MSWQERSRSRRLWERSSDSLVGGVGGNMRGVVAGWRPHPLFFDHGDGAQIVDVDGHAYVDYVCGYGPLILGHRPRSVIEAVSSAMSREGTLIGGSTELEMKVSERLCEHVPSFEQVRYANSGSEAVMSALRLARVYTNRSKILRFEGHYHGQSDTVNFNSKPSLEMRAKDGRLRTLPSTGGLPRGLEQEVVVCEWNDRESVNVAMADHGEELAAIICEPVAANCGVVEPKEGFLDFLRAKADEHGTVLIFDEIKTGFRMGLGGAQRFYGVIPDLTTVSKAMAAGVPIAGLGGKRALMELIEEGRVWQSATFHSNVMAMAACAATLDVLEEPGFFESLWERGETLAKGLRGAAAAAERDVWVMCVGPMVSVLVGAREGDGWTCGDVARRMHPNEQSAFWSGMLDRGVYVHPDGLQTWYMSGAHTANEIEFTVEQVEAALAEK